MQGEAPGNDATNGVKLFARFVDVQLSLITFRQRCTGYTYTNTCWYNGEKQLVSAHCEQTFKIPKTNFKHQTLNHNAH